MNRRVRQLAGWAVNAVCAGPRRAAATAADLVAGGVAGATLADLRTDRVARRVLGVWQDQPCPPGTRDIRADAGWWAARQTVRCADSLGLPADLTVAWAAGGLLTPAHRNPGRWLEPNGPARWIGLGDAAPAWHAAGYSPADAAALAGLPPGHPDRPSPVDLAVQGCLRSFDRTEP